MGLQCKWKCVYVFAIILLKIENKIKKGLNVFKMTQKLSQNYPNIRSKNHFVLIFIKIVHGGWKHMKGRPPLYISNFWPCICFHLLARVCVSIFWPCMCFQLSASTKPNFTQYKIMFSQENLSVFSGKVVFSQEK